MPLAFQPCSSWSTSPTGSSSFFHDSAGLSWGVAIIALTVCTRALLIPLTYKQLKGMRALQALQPQIKEIQAKYKNDKQRMQQEMMRFYKENKVNPFASCIPLLAQLPVFITLFYVLRHELPPTSAARPRKPAANSRSPKATQPASSANSSSSTT